MLDPYQTSSLTLMVSPCTTCETSLSICKKLNLTFRIIPHQFRYGHQGLHLFRYMLSVVKPQDANFRTTLLDQTFQDSQSTCRFWISLIS